ncbi:MAG: hypothetical protein ACP5D6_06325 [Kosmotogaceae bacterium]
MENKMRFLCPICGSNNLTVQGYVMAEWEIDGWVKQKNGYFPKDIVESSEELGDSEFWSDEPLRCKVCGATFNYPAVEEEIRNEKV